MQKFPEIIFENEDIFVINKDESWLIYPEKGIFIKDKKYLSEIYNNKFYEDKWEDVNRKGFAHRIDEDTSGLILATKNLKTLKKIQKKFKERQIEKWYITVVQGNLPEMGIIDAPLTRQDGTTKQKVSSISYAKDSISSFFKIAYDPKSNSSLLFVYLHTGRTHQIRVHLASIKSAIIGDKLYNKKKSDHLFLHAISIGLKIGKDNFIFYKEPPTYFTNFINQNFKNINLKDELSQIRKYFKTNWDQFISNQKKPITLGYPLTKD